MRMTGKRNARVRDERKKREGERAVRDDGGAAFIGLWIYTWEREGGKDTDGFRGERGVS